jgi:acyl-coenzyme A thioesterase PaaI-like protein
MAWNPGGVNELLQALLVSPLRPGQPPAGGGGLPGGPDYGRLAENLRHLLDVVSGSRPPDDLVTRVADQLAEISAELEPFMVPEAEQVAGNRLDLVGRGQVLTPPVIWDELDGDHALGRTTLGRRFLGGRDAAHGGAIPLLFDEVLGVVANIGRSFTRTAYLNVNFRAITPIDEPLRFEATVDRGEGRKWFINGRLLWNDTVCADAEGLFIELRPGQP